MTKNISISSTSELIAAWIARPSDGTTLEIEGGDRGGWYLAWDHPEWDCVYPLDASCPVDEIDAWSIIARGVFCPPDPTGAPVTYPHRSTITRAGHFTVEGDDGRGYDNGERTYSWQTLDMLLSALVLTVPEDVLQAIAARWVDGQAAKAQHALEMAKVQAAKTQAALRLHVLPAAEDA